MEADLILRGGILICMDTQRTVRRGDLVISGGRIAAIEAPARQKARRVIDVAGSVILPGFVQCHTRLNRMLFRRAEDEGDAVRRERLLRLEAGHDRASAFSSAVLGVAELLRGGTTAVLDLGDGVQAEMIFQALDGMGLRGVSGLTLADRRDSLPASLCRQTDTAIEDAELLCRRWHNAAGGRLRYGVNVRGPLWCSKLLLSKAGQLARGQKLPLSASVAPDREAAGELRERYGVSPLRMLLDSGFVGPDTVLGQCDVCRAEELPLLLRSGGSICHCPGATPACGDGLVSLPEMLSVGVNVALGCDDPLRNPSLDMFEVMRRAIALQEAREGGPATLSAQAVLEMATIGGARAIGLAGEIGSLMPGRKADLLVLKLEGGKVGEAGEDVVRRVVLEGSAEQVTHTLVDGRVLLDERRLVDVDWEGLLVEAARESGSLLRRVDGGAQA